MQDVADAEVDRDRIPGRADAERIDLAAGQAVDHVGRRQHHQMNVLVGIDAAGGHPEPQLIIVGRERKGHAEGQGLGAALAPRRDDARQRQRGGHRIEAVSVDFRHDGRMQRRRNRDRVAVEAEIERRCDRQLDVAEAEARRDRDRRQQMGGVEQPDVELVADIRPRHFPHQCDVEPFRCGKALVDGHDKGRGIDQRDEAYAKRCGHFSNSDAVRIDCAISPIFFFSRIAVDRSST